MLVFDIKRLNAKVYLKRQVQETVARKVIQEQYFSSALKANRASKFVYELFGR